ncbi:amidase [Candidatus Amarolinea aalborgensis]|jgi:Asp-tRNA(Asn)/Glu-tRNA(Gln) amidotransferase A subunit family amidase|uniref:amidase n=1 Tax=Candidatus Amarolinea aalborgensis TaxID=2249329 RepID=UPI003BF9725A
MSDYDLHALNLPKLAGRSLTAFAGALANPVSRAALMPNLLKQGGFDRFRALRLEEPPTFYPLTPAAAPAAEPLAPAAVEEALGPYTAGAVFTTARDFAHAYRQGLTTPDAVAQRVVDAIKASEAGDPPLRAFIASDAADILAQARASTARFAAGQPLSLLDGVPVAIKDELDQTPYPTTVGTTFLAQGPAVADATAVARLRAAGALLIGKANMHEIGINPNGANAHYGAARNPYDTARDPGGSSSGPAVAVAAGLCPIAIGADGGGSIRIPASLCGLVGLKPTFGRVSEAGAAPLCWSVAHVGPLGATVEDVALAYGLIAGPDPRDPNSQQQPAVSLDDWNASDLAGLTIGVYQPWFRHAAPAVVAANEAMLAQFERAGAQVREIAVPELDAMRLAHIIIILSEMAASMRNHGQGIRRLGPSVQTTLALANGFSAPDYVKAQRMRTRALAIFHDIFQHVDVILTPATAITAPVIPAGAGRGAWSDLSADTEVMRFIFPGNLTGLPAVSFPVGYDGAGMPIGMQAIGRHWAEATLLRVAYVAEQRTPRRRPARYHPLLASNSRASGLQRV